MLILHVNSTIQHKKVCLKTKKRGVIIFIMFEKSKKMYWLASSRETVAQPKHVHYLDRFVIAY